MFRFQLRTKITLLTVSVMGLLLTLVTLLTFSVGRDIVHDNVNKNASAQVKIHSQYLTNWLHTRLAEMEMMSVSSEIRSGDEETIMNYLKKEMERQDGLYLSFSIGDKNGYAYSVHRIYSNVGNDPGFQQALEGKATISNPIPSLENPNNLMVRFYMPIQNKAGNVTKVLFGETKINTVFKENTNFKLGNEDIVYLVDKEGNVIFHPDKSKILTYNLKDSSKEEQQLMLAMQKEKEGVHESTFFSSVENTEWFLVWDVPKEELTSSLEDLLNISFSSIIVAIFLVGVFMFWILNGMFKRLHAVVNFTKQIAEGNINIPPMTEKKQDEIALLTDANNQMLIGLQNVFHQLNEGVSTSANNVLSSSQELASSADETMTSSKQIASMIEEVATESEKQIHMSEQNVLLVNEMLQGIHQITHSAMDVKNFAELTTEKANNGTKNMNKTKTQMERIQETVMSSTPTISALKTRSNEIEQIVDVINGLTNNINLLSLNASIEAARAGEHGRGFKVVADEVKKLAHETSESANQIAKLIGQTQENVSNAEEMMNSIQSEVEEGMNLTMETVSAFGDISTSVEKVTRQITEVSVISEELLAGSEQMLETFKQLSETSKMNSLHFHSVSTASEQQVASMQHMTEYAEQLAKMAQNLRELIQKINL